MRTKPLSFLVGLSVVLLGGCVSIDEFALPAGDAERGQATFVELGCVQCHSAGGVRHERDGRGFHLTLGSVTGEKSYRELVTSIINPSHRIARADGAVRGRSRMPNFNQTMTVQQLTDLVHFLAPQYELLVVPTYEYPEYEYPF